MCNIRSSKRFKNYVYKLNLLFYNICYVNKKLVLTGLLRIIRGIAKKDFPARMCRIASIFHIRG